MVDSQLQLIFDVRDEARHHHWKFCRIRNRTLKRRGSGLEAIGESCSEGKGLGLFCTFAHFSDFQASYSNF